MIDEPLRGAHLTAYGLVPQNPSLSKRYRTGLTKSIGPMAQKGVETKSMSPLDGLRTSGVRPLLSPDSVFKIKRREL